MPASVTLEEWWKHFRKYMEKGAGMQDTVICPKFSIPGTLLPLFWRQGEKVNITIKIDVPQEEGSSRSGEPVFFSPLLCAADGTRGRANYIVSEFTGKTDHFLDWRKEKVWRS